ncbi:MAG TPA: hypothetical protein VFG84_06500, partial [Gemmatimonadaceae bacterium]|nr:hypothetical protein [Gemmatimonadaceae bacterium]
MQRVTAVFAAIANILVPVAPILAAVGDVLPRIAPVFAAIPHILHPIPGGPPQLRPRACLRCSAVGERQAHRNGGHRHEISASH